LGFCQQSFSFDPFRFFYPSLPGLPVPGSYHLIGSPQALHLIHICHGESRNAFAAPSGMSGTFAFDILTSYAWWRASTLAAFADAREPDDDCQGLLLWGLPVWILAQLFNRRLPPSLERHDCCG